MSDALERSLTLSRAGFITPNDFATAPVPPARETPSSTCPAGARLPRLHPPPERILIGHVLALILSRGGLITPDDFNPGVGRTPTGNSFDHVPLEDLYHAAIHSLERSPIERALHASAGNKTRAAELLKVNRRLLYDKLKDIGME